MAADYAKDRPIYPKGILILKGGRLHP
jgi:hypothetical protein